jgi:hypothetical protein
MAIKISSSTVISDALALNNIASLDTASATSIVKAFDLNTSITAGATAKARRTATVSSASAAAGYQLQCQYTMIQSGSVRFAITASVAISNGQGLIRVMRNRAGTSTSVFSSSLTTTSTVYTTDQTVEFGDEYDIQVSGTSTGSGKSLVTYAATITQSELRAGTTDVYIPGWSTTDTVIIV